jgi:acyl transferase domain-containing protein
VSSDSNTDYRVLLRDAALEIRSLRDKLETVEKAQKEPLAIIGMGCRFPGKANDPESLWRLLCDGVDAVTEVPANRWNADVFYDPDPMTPGKANTRWGGFLEEIDLFDPYFFGISPREAAYMDPQQRLLLEVAWEALEDAGQVLDSLRGSQTGVFVGIYNSDYSWLQLATPNHIDVYSAAGSGHSIAANRLSYLLDLHGPSVAIDTACSSSLLAIHMACQSLRHRECDLALAGGVNLILSPLSMIATSKVLSMASDGRCKTFDARADGLVRGEGCGMVALKRLSDARADGDPILALIRGSAANQDGRSAGLTAPNMLAQQRVIQQALENAKVKPEQVSYIESHGTGTTLGDPIEIDALKAAFGQFSNGRRCLIGALKTNIGHLEAAAGVAGLIKAVLVLKHEAVPPNLHFRTLNPNISFENTPFAIPTQVSPWPSGAEPRYAGVNSFGAGGTNVHVVLEEAPAFPAADEDDVLPPSQAHLLLLSAQGEKPLLALAEAYQQFLATEQAGKEVPLRNLCYTASVRRSHHKQRLALVGHSPREFAGKLDEFLQDGTCSGMSVGKAWNQRRGLVFVFSGQGAQWPGMGQELLAREQVFRQVIEQCDVLLRQYGDLSLLQEISAGKEQSRLGQTAIVQPVTFALQVALAALWRSWGVVPDAVVGHSVGEVAAAHVAGVLSLEDAMRVAFHRGQLMEQAAGRGKMAVVGLPVEQAQAAIGGYEDRLSIAAINSPKATVLSGEAATLEKVLQSLDTHIFRRMLRLDYAFHSHQMEAIQPALVEALQEIEPRPAAIPIFSTLTGQLSNGRGFDAAYWGRQVRKPVLFAAAINQLTEDQNAVFVEISSHPVLSANISECLHYRDQAGSVLPSLRRDNEEQAMMLSTLGALYTLGYPLDWKRLYPSGRCIRLPSYPWQRERLWLEAEPLHHQLQITASEPPGQLHETGHQPQGERREEGLTTAVLLSIEPEKRRQVLENYLCRRLSEVLNIPVSRIDVNEPLTGMGIDSLMGVQRSKLWGGCTARELFPGFGRSSIGCIAA